MPRKLEFFLEAISSFVSIEKSKDSFPNIPALNPKFLRTAYDVKAYVLLIAIRPSDEDVKTGGPLSAFRYE